MRDAADNVHAEVERALKVARRVGGTEIAVLGKRDELQIEIGLHPLFHIEQRFDGDQPVVANVNMAANGEQALRDSEIAVTQRTLRHRFVGEMRFEFAPEGDSLKQRARDVQTRKSKRQGRVEMKVAVDEGRGEKVSVGVDRLSRFGHDRRLDRSDAAACDCDVLSRSAHPAALHYGRSNRRSCLVQCFSVREASAVDTGSPIEPLF